MLCRRCHERTDLPEDDGRLNIWFPVSGMVQGTFIVGGQLYVRPA
jgi:hypothetical protein